MISKRCALRGPQGESSFWVRGTAAEGMDLALKNKTQVEEKAGALLAGAGNSPLGRIPRALEICPSFSGQRRVSEGFSPEDWHVVREKGLPRYTWCPC